MARQSSHAGRRSEHPECNEPAIPPCGRGGSTAWLRARSIDSFAEDGRREKAGRSAGGKYPRFGQTEGRWEGRRTGSKGFPTDRPDRRRGLPARRGAGRCPSSSAPSRGTGDGAGPGYFPALPRIRRGIRRGSGEGSTVRTHKASGNRWDAHNPRGPTGRRRRSGPGARISPRSRAVPALSNPESSSRVGYRDRMLRDLRESAEWHGS